MLEGLLQNLYSPINIPVFIFSQILIFFSVILPRKEFPISLIRVTLFPVFILATLYNFNYDPDVQTRIVMLDYVSGAVLAGAALFSSGMVLMQDPQELKYNGQAKPTAEYGIAWRTWWAMRMMFNVRGIGWSFQVANVVPPTQRKYQSRPGFLIAQTLRLARNILVADAMQLYIFSHPYILFQQNPNPPVWEPVVRTAVLGICAVLFMQTVHTLFSLVSVGLGISRPTEWPEWFGALADMYTVRNFWGRVWHQSVQNMVVPHNRFVARTLLRLPRGSFLSALVQLLVAFALSALLHVGGDYKAVRRLDISWLFFVSQAFAIAAEDLVFRLFAWTSVSIPVWARRLVGYIWVVAWFTFSVPWILGPWIEMGMVMQDLPMTVSVLRGISTGEWVQNRF